MDIDWHQSYEDGKKAFDNMDYKAALENLKKVAAVKDGFADVYNMLGVIYFYDNKTNDAIKSFLDALRINPGYTEALLNLSVVYNEAGEFEKAQAVYAQAVASSKSDRTTYLDPVVKGKLANMHLRIAQVYKELGIYEDAVYEYRKALNLRPEFADIRTSLGMVYRDMRDYSRAVREFEEALRLNPDYSNARIQLGLTYYVMGEMERAKAEWLKVTRENPNDRLAKMYLNILEKKS